MTPFNTFRGKPAGIAQLMVTVQMYYSGTCPLPGALTKRILVVFDILIGGHWIYWVVVFRSHHWVALETARTGE
jgi:hypothetical protein